MVQFALSTVGQVVVFGDNPHTKNQIDPFRRLARGVYPTPAT